MQFPEPGVRQGLLAAGFSETSAAAFIELAAAYNDGRIQAGVTRTAANTTATTLETFGREVFAPAYLAAAAASAQKAKLA
ncbi:hypothetical protein BH23GEM2_BH23GEM2_20850 [soil metagenome]